jgi:hypothetical protein
MSIFSRLRVSEERVRQELSGLDWRGGLTTAEIMAQLRGLPADLFGDLADGAIFHSPDEVVQSMEGQVDRDPGDMATEGAESLGGPAGYGESSTGRLVMTPNTSHGVGSGTDTGDTGSGNTEATGWGGPGTTFGEEAVKEDIEEELGP